MGKKIVVPQGMLAAAGAASDGLDPQGLFLIGPLQGALRWIDEQLELMIQDNPYLHDVFHRSESLSENYVRTGRNNAIKELRSMFLVAESPSIDDLLVRAVIGQVNGEQINERIREAYRRGQKAPR